MSTAWSALSAALLHGAAPVLGVLLLGVVVLQLVHALLPPLPQVCTWGALLLLVGGLAFWGQTDALPTLAERLLRLLFLTGCAALTVLCALGILEAHVLRGLGGQQQTPLLRWAALLLVGGGLLPALLHTPRALAERGAQTADAGPVWMNWEAGALPLTGAIDSALSLGATCWSAALLLDLAGGVLQRAWPQLPVAFLAMPMRLLVVLPLAACGLRAC